MATVHGDAPNDRPPHQCMASWSVLAPCPNDYTHVIETVHAAGFMRVCPQHREGYRRSQGTADTRLWTREAWEAAGREAELLQQIETGKVMESRAELVARANHAGQVDRQDQPYIRHVQRVVERLRPGNHFARAVAWLHDVVEDTTVTLDDLRTLHHFPPEIVTAVELLTRVPPYDYDSYIERLAGNDLARRVKAADLQDHLQRVHELPMPDRERLSSRYRRAYSYLLMHMPTYELPENARPRSIPSAEGW